MLGRISRPGRGCHYWRLSCRLYSLSPSSSSPLPLSSANPDSYSLFRAQKVDSQVAAELAAVRQHGGVFKNKHNEYSDRISKRITRNQSIARKAMAAAGESREVAALTGQYEQAKASRKLESEREKALKAELDAKKGKASRTRVRRTEVTEGEASSSSGRAPKSQTSRGNARVHPYLSLEAEGGFITLTLLFVSTSLVYTKLTIPVII